MEREASGAEAETVALALETLGNVLAADGKLPAAEARYQEALAIATRTAGPGRNLEGSILLDLATVQEVLGRHRDARTTAERALASARGQRGQSLVARANELLARLPQGP
jgi:hypothetical protein